MSEGTEQFPAYLLGTALLQSATCRKPATSNPPTHPCAPLYPTPPSSCCAPIKAELIKPQLIASAGGGRRRKKRWGGGGGGVQLYVGLYLPFLTYNALLAVTSQCIWLTLTHHPHPCRCSSWLIDGTLAVSEACF